MRDISCRQHVQLRRAIAGSTRALVAWSRRLTTVRCCCARCCTCAPPGLLLLDVTCIAPWLPLASLLPLLAPARAGAAPAAAGAKAAGCKHRTA